ncbi:TPA: conjugal transfer protein [Streptococcus suis]|nr:conjugal transfer protein [Streptococcus suis]HEM5326429.1 conjugal transfer protein [Streptococcus suis]
MNALLFDERPIVANPVLAREIGLNEAIVLQQINFWLEVNKQNGKNFHDGRYWTYNSIRAWHESDFSYLSYETVKRTFSKLEKAGFLLTANYNKDPRDKTKWYSLDFERIFELQEMVKIKRNQIAEKALDEGINSTLTNALGQNDPMEKFNLTQCTRSKSSTALVQNDLMHGVNLNQPLPNNTTNNTTDVTSFYINQSIEEGDELEKLKIQVQYELLVQSGCREKLCEWDEVLPVIADVFYQQEGTISINQMRLPIDFVKDRFRQLTMYHIDYICECLSKVDTNIRNIRAYILTTAFNAPQTIGAYYSNQVKQDFGGNNL